MNVDRLIKPAVFGAFDGVVTVLGVLFALAADPHALVLSGVGLAAAGTVSMAGGQYLSDNDNGLSASLVIGATTGLGTLVPVLPYTVARGVWAGVVSAVLCLAVAGAIAWSKTTGNHGLSARRSVLSTYGILLLATVATLLCAWATGAIG